MKWNGFECAEFMFEGYEATVVIPEKPLKNAPIIFKTCYFNAFPYAETELVKRGFYLCGIDEESLWGKESDIERKARFIKHVAKKFGTAEKCVPVGMSCGGLIAVQFAAKYPELVSCMYLDAPVMNLMSCPCGFGTGKACEKDLPIILSDLGLKNISELICFRKMPMDNIPILVENRIPVVMVSGDSDNTVPYCENGILLEKAYKENGIDTKVYIKEGGDHHPHSLDDPAPIVDFILKHI